MKRSILYAIISASTLLLSGVGSYVAIDIVERKQGDSLPSDQTGMEGFVPGESGTVQSNFGKFINKALTMQQLKSESSKVTLSNNENEDFEFTFSDLDINLEPLFQLKAPQAKGTFHISNDVVDESFNFASQNEFLYFSNESNYICTKTSETIDSILPILTAVGIPLPNPTLIENLISKITVDEIISNLEMLEEFVIETKTENSYSFLIDFTYYSNVLQLPFSNFKLEILTDLDFNLAAVHTIDDGISINNLYQVKVNCDFTPIYESAYVPLSEDETSKYVDMTEFNSHVFTIITQLLESKNFEISFSSVSESFDVSDTLKKKETIGTIKGDLSADGNNLDTGVFEITADESVEGKNTKNIYALYRQEMLYFSHNDWLHFKLNIGKLSENIHKIIEIIGGIFGKESTQSGGILDKIDFASGDIKRIFEDLYLLYKASISQVQYTQNSILLQFDTKNMNLGDLEFTIILEREGTAENPKMKITVNRITAQKDTRKTVYILDPVDKIVLSKTEDELSRF
jgi:hypothetical protein